MDLSMIFGKIEALQYLLLFPVVESIKHGQEGRLNGSAALPNKVARSAGFSKANHQDPPRTNSLLTASHGK